jgi:hypothetical protein
MNGDLHGGLALSTFVRSRLRVATLVAALALLGLLAVPAGAFASNAIDPSGVCDGQTLNVVPQFTVPSSPASWQIDNVYVDPYRSG